MFIKLLLILPALTLASRIELEVKGEFNDEEPDLTALLYGEDSSIATNKERKLFGLQDDTIKDAIKMIHGGRPDNVYICSPTPWGDLYKTYGWDQVQRSLVPSHATLINKSSKPVTIIQQTFENNSTKPVIVNVALFKDVKTTITSYWSKLADMTVEDVKYKFSLDVKGVPMSVNHVFGWGKDGKGFKSDYVGSTSEINLILQPRQAVIAKLEAKKAFISIKFDYEAILQGSAVCNYEKPFKGHHFYKYDINDIIDIKNLPLKSKSSQIISLTFYYDSKVVVNDQKIGTKLIEKTFSQTSTSTGEKDSERNKQKTSSKAEVSESSEQKISDEKTAEEKITRIALTIPMNLTSIANDNSTANDISTAV